MTDKEKKEKTIIRVDGDWYEVGGMVRPSVGQQFLAAHLRVEKANFNFSHAKRHPLTPIPSPIQEEVEELEKLRAVRLAAEEVAATTAADHIPEFVRLTDALAAFDPPERFTVDGWCVLDNGERVFQGRHTDDAKTAANLLNSLSLPVEGGVA